MAAATVCALLLGALVLGLTAAADAAICGGSIPCQCGDTVGSDYLMTADLGPCPRLSGVDTGGLSSKTMESRLVPGLFFIGEVVDVTGWLGGYNFQWAWSSGHAAGEVA